jgi:hypothetical protein
LVDNGAVQHSIQIVQVDVDSGLMPIATPTFTNRPIPLRQNKLDTPRSAPKDATAPTLLWSFSNIP